MKVLVKQPYIDVTKDDDFLYSHLLNLLNEIRLVQGGTALDATLRRHNQMRLYLMSKQIEKIRLIEEKYFNQDGTLNQDSIKNFHLQSK